MVPSTFLFLYQPSVCLCVSRVRAYLTTNQQHGIPCLIKRGPLPDWPVWTRAQKEGSAAARGEGSSEDKKETAPLKRARRLFAPQLVPKLAPQLVPQLVPQFVPQLVPQLVLKSAKIMKIEATLSRLGRTTALRRLRQQSRQSLSLLWRNSTTGSLPC